MVHNKGWTVKDACAYWGIRYETFNKRCNNPKMFNQLESMCLGLESKIPIKITIHSATCEFRDNQ